jgi:rhodanese-related sulfurtransferase
MIKTGAQLVQEVKPQITEVTTSDLANNLAKDIVLIDVREPGEFAEGHIAGSVNFPRGVLEMKIQMHPQFKDAEAPLEEMNKHEIYLICRSGARSALAANSLQTMGFDKVKSVAGGMMAWQEQGLHTEK